jgi:transposase
MNNPSVYYKTQGPQRHQLEMQFSCLDMLIPEDHPVRNIWSFVEEMDIRSCFDKIKSFVGCRGRSTTNPKILLTLWIYSLMEGNASARKLEELCKNHNVYKWIAGGASINRTLLAEFRSHDPFKFEDLLVSCLAVMLKHGVIKDEDFAQDGTRVKANAGFNSFRREDSLEKLKAELKMYIKQLKEEVETAENTYEKRQKERKQRHAIEKYTRVQKALDELKSARETRVENAQRNREKLEEEELENVRASATDPEARKMKMGDGGYRLAYNVQFATGLDSRVIFGVDVVNTLDPGTAPRMIGKINSLLQQLKMKAIRYWLGDSAYSGKADIETVAELYPEVTYFGPPKARKGIDPKKHLKNDSESVKLWRDLIGNEKIEEIYKKRCSTAEFSNAQVKNHGFTEFLVRGFEKVKGEAILQAVAHNIQRFLSLKAYL